MIYAGPTLQQDCFNVLVHFCQNPVGIACDIKRNVPPGRDWGDRSFPFPTVVESPGPKLTAGCIWVQPCNVWKEFSPYGVEVCGAGECSKKPRPLSPCHWDRTTWTALLTVLKLMKKEWSCTVNWSQLKALWGIANMHARKWISNSPEVIEAIPTEECTTEIVINSGQDPVTETIGIWWNSTEDLFIVTASPVLPDFQTMKWNVLHKESTIFDPLGFVCLYVIVAKILLQELWIRDYDWDDEVQNEIAYKIRDWFKQLKEVKIPGCLRSPEPVKSMRIVTFVDVSQQAYGAAVYIWCKYYHNDAITSRLIAAESKVTLLTLMTVPRLELMGAILGLCLTQSLLMALELPMQSMTFYSDSTDILWWIWGRGKDFPPFVANKIGEKQMLPSHHSGSMSLPTRIQLICARELQPLQV